MTESIASNTARLVRTARDAEAPLHDQHAAFARLVERFQHDAFGLALALLGDADDAKDAAQGAFTTAWLRLRQLRDPSAFAPWFKSIVARGCAHQRRHRARSSELLEQPVSVGDDSDGVDYQSLVASAVAQLPAGEQRVTILFYFLGYTQPQIARLLRLKAGTVGKRLHSARLRIRRSLPRSVRGDFVPLTPSRPFIERVRRGLLDEYTGDYRFDTRPDHIVSIRREGDALIGLGGGQRHILVSVAEGSLLTSHYDGEGRFRRDRRGRVTHFVYYEFGRRMGIARKVDRAAR